MITSLRNQLVTYFFFINYYPHLNLTYVARHDKTTPLSFTFILKQKFCFYLFFAKLWYDSLLWNRGVRKINFERYRL